MRKSRRASSAPPENDPGGQVTSAARACLALLPVSG